MVGPPYHGSYQNIECKRADVVKHKSEARNSNFETNSNDQIKNFRKRINLKYPLPWETVSQYKKTDFSEKGERRSGGKDLER